jgi:hypothetical protein
MRSLNRAFFQKTVPLAAAALFEVKHIAPTRKFLEHDVLQVDRLPAVSQLDAQSGRKALLLDPKIRAHGIELVLRLTVS